MSLLDPVEQKTIEPVDCVVNKWGHTSIVGCIEMSNETRAETISARRRVDLAWWHEPLKLREGKAALDKGLAYRVNTMALLDGDNLRVHPISPTTENRVVETYRSIAAESLDVRNGDTELPDEGFAVVLQGERSHLSIDVEVVPVTEQARLGNDVVEHVKRENNMFCQRL